MAAPESAQSRFTDSIHAFEVSILDGALDFIGRAKRPWACGSANLKLTSARQTELRKFPKFKFGWWKEEWHRARMILGILP